MTLCIVKTPCKVFGAGLHGVYDFGRIKKEA